MALVGLTDRVFRAVAYIDSGRKGLAANGEEHEGRISYEIGISAALSAFKEAQTIGDSQTFILAELTFLQQELHFCNDADTITQSSLTQAIQNFEDALRCLKIVEDTEGYRSAEATHLTTPKYRIQGLPKDAFHLACIAHWTRLQNSLRTPGIDMKEKIVLQQRAVNMTAAQRSYIEKQKIALIDGYAQLRTVAE
jgi:hypothetical protein